MARVQVTIEVDTDLTDIQWPEFRQANRVMTSVKDRMSHYNPRLIAYKKVDKTT